MALPDLTDLFVADTYSGVLHTSNETLTTPTLKTIYDGVGNPSSLKLSTTLASISDITYPASDPGYSLSLMVSNGTKTLTLSSWSQIQQFVGTIDNGTYTNPTVTVTNGVITGLASTSIARGMRTYSTAGTHTFIVPARVSYIKFIVTGGGSTGGETNGSAGATAIGLLAVSEGQTYTLTVGAGGGNSENASGAASIIHYIDTNIVTANGGVTILPPLLDATQAAVAVIDNAFGIIREGVSLISGGFGGIDTNASDEESVGGAGYWGSAPAYGGGGGGHSGDRQGYNGTTGVVVLEW